MDDFHADLVRRVLLTALSADNLPDWSTQGFGMARTYVGSRDVRINVWHSALLVPGLDFETGMVHTHPWDFRSRIVCGTLTNTRWLHDANGAEFWEARITPGPGGDFTNADGRATAPSGYPTRELVLLRPAAQETYVVGDVYGQRHDEIHHTSYVDGTVTINRRHRGDLPDAASTFWRKGRDWISAEPITAGIETAVEKAILGALDLLGGAS